MGFLQRTADDCKLRFRYACRRLGIQRYQIHQVYLRQQKLIYIPIPKNACTSIKHALHEVEFVKRFDSDLPEFSNYREHHEYYKKRANAFTSIEKLRSQTRVTRFAVVRDPVRRLLSCYRNRVLDLGDLEQTKAAVDRIGLPLKPDLNNFFLNLERYRSINKSIEHHSRPQAQFLGGTIDYLDQIFTLGELPQLLEMLKTFKPDLELRRRKTGGTEVSVNDLSEEAKQAAISYYREDYRLLSDYLKPDYVSYLQ